MNRIVFGVIKVWFFVSAFAGILYGQLSVEIEAVPLSEVDARTAAIALGVDLDALRAADRDQSGEILAFDLTNAIDILGNPRLFKIVDDGEKSRNSCSGGAFTGVDLDAIGGIGTNANPVWANSVIDVAFGPEDSLPGGDILCQKAKADSRIIEGLQGDTLLEGFPQNVLGPPDATSVVGMNSNYTSIGSAGELLVSFPNGLTDANIVNGFDLFLFEVAGANDTAVYLVVPAPPTSASFAGVLFVFGIVRRRLRQRSKAIHETAPSVFRNPTSQL